MIKSFNILNKSVDDKSAIFIGKIIGQDTLLDIAKVTAKLHKPIVFNWPAKFGLPPIEQATSAPVATKPKEIQGSLQQSNSTPGPSVANPPKDQAKPKKKFVCHTCGIPVAYNVAKFCWFNKSKFGENIYCMGCQKKV